MPATIVQSGGDLELGRFYRLTFFDLKLGQQLGEWGVNFKVNLLGFGATTMGDLAAKMLDNANVKRVHLLGSNDIFYGAKVADVSVGPKQLPGAATLNLPGTGVGIASAGQVSGLIRLQTKMAGKKGRGRMYLPFPLGSAYDDNTGFPTAAYQFEAQTFADDLFTKLRTPGLPAGITLTPVIYHRATATSDDITTVTVPLMFATQKRRGDFGKLNALPF